MKFSECVPGLCDSASAQRVVLRALISIPQGYAQIAHAAQASTIVVPERIHGF
jgi:hypothetical protein